MFGETILIVRDDIRVQNFIKYALEEEGYRTLYTDRSKQAVEMAMTRKVDMILLDMGLPNMGGKKALTRLREQSDIPVIIVSARNQEKEKVMALDIGADDYLTEPFLVNEFLVRVRLTFHHYFRTDEKRTSSYIKSGGLEVDSNEHTTSRAGEEIRLTKLEFALLFLFVQSQGKVLTYGCILKGPHGKNYGSDTQALCALMAGLRRRIEGNPARPRYITAEIGIRYRMMEQ